MEDKVINVEYIDNNWGVKVSNTHGNSSEHFIKMQSKEDAVLYARVCEQRTGCKVLIK